MKERKRRFWSALLTLLMLCTLTQPAFAGTITNNGAFINTANATLTNGSSGRFTNSGSFTNNGTVTNNGTFTVAQGGTLVNNESTGRFAGSQKIINNTSNPDAISGVDPSRIASGSDPTTITHRVKLPPPSDFTVTACKVNGSAVTLMEDEEHNKFCDVPEGGKFSFTLTLADGTVFGNEPTKLEVDKHPKTQSWFTVTAPATTASNYRTVRTVSLTVDEDTVDDGIVDLSGLMLVTPVYTVISGTWQFNSDTKPLPDNIAVTGTAKIGEAGESVMGGSINKLLIVEGGSLTVIFGTGNTTIGVADNSGTLTITGSTYVTGAFVNNGTINFSGEHKALTVTNKGKLTNAAGKTVNVGLGATLTNNGTIENNGKILGAAPSDGKYSLYSGSALTGGGTVSNMYCEVTFDSNSDKVFTTGQTYTAYAPYNGTLPETDVTAINNQANTETWGETFLGWCDSRSGTEPITDYGTRVYKTGATFYAFWQH